MWIRLCEVIHFSTNFPQKSFVEAIKYRNLVYDAGRIIFFRRVAKRSIFFSINLCLSPNMHDQISFIAPQVLPAELNCAIQEMRSCWTNTTLESNKSPATYQFNISGTLSPKNCSQSLQQLFTAISCSSFMSRSFSLTSRIISS